MSNIHSIEITKQKWETEALVVELCPMQIFDYLVNKRNYNHILFNNSTKLSASVQDEMEGREAIKNLIELELDTRPFL